MWRHPKYGRCLWLARGYGSEDGGSCVGMMVYMMVNQVIMTVVMMVTLVWW